MTKRQTPYAFFREHAGYAYDPKIETAAQGRARCARALAAAEQWARDEGYSFSWSIDPLASSADWIADGGRDCDPWAVWQCAMLDPEGDCAASLHGIDFGREGRPYGDPYRRVVEAELAAEVQARAERKAE